MYVESGYNVVRVSMRIVLRIGPPSYTILVRSCVSLCCAVLSCVACVRISLVIYLCNIIRMHGTMNIKCLMLLCAAVNVKPDIFSPRKNMNFKKMAQDSTVKTQLIRQWSIYY